MVQLRRRWRRRRWRRRRWRRRRRRRRRGRSQRGSRAVPAQPPQLQPRPPRRRTTKRALGPMGAEAKSNRCYQYFTFGAVFRACVPFSTSERPTKMAEAPFSLPALVRTRGQPRGKRAISLPRACSREVLLPPALDLAAPGLSQRSRPSVRASVGASASIRIGGRVVVGRRLFPLRHVSLPLAFCLASPRLAFGLGLARARLAPLSPRAPATDAARRLASPRLASPRLAAARPPSPFARSRTPTMRWSRTSTRRR